MVNSKHVNGALVYYEEGNESRWLDVMGLNITKFNLESGTAQDDQTPYVPTRFTVREISTGGGVSTIVNAEAVGTKLLITTDDADFDGVQAQLKGEAFKLSSAKPLYFGIKCSISDATESDLLVGLCEAHTDLLKESVAHGVAAADVEGVFFFKLDHVTTIAAKTYKDAAETGTANCATAMDTSAHIYEIVWDGTTVYFYMDGILVTSVAASLPDGDLTPSINFRTGEAAVKTATVYWMKAFQIN